MASGPGIDPEPHWWKASALTTAPTLLHVLILVERSYRFCACAQEFDNFIDLVQCRTQFERNPWIESIEIQFDWAHLICFANV